MSRSLGSVICLGWLVLSACNVVTKIGDECPAGGCSTLHGCSEVVQYPRPAGVDGGVSDEALAASEAQACEDCIATNERLTIKNTQLSACGCNHCAAQLGACFDSVNSEEDGDTETRRKRDQDCRLMVECSWAHQCAGTECYCGKDVDRIQCLLDIDDGAAHGPCAQTIRSTVVCADGINEGDCVLSAMQKSATAIARASELGKCVSGDVLLLEAFPAQCPFDRYTNLR